MKILSGEGFSKPWNVLENEHWKSMNPVCMCVWVRLSELPNVTRGKNVTYPLKLPSFYFSLFPSHSPLLLWPAHSTLAGHKHTDNYPLYNRFLIGVCSFFPKLVHNTDKNDTSSPTLDKTYILDIIHSRPHWLRQY